MMSKISFSNLLRLLITIIFITTIISCSSEATNGKTDKDCTDFATQEEAQAYFNANGGSSTNNFNGLDGDHDGICCETLPSSPTNDFTNGDIITGKVISVIDGDTIILETSGEDLTIRLSEIDCPEKSQSYGVDAKEYTTSIALGKSVTAYVESTDQYNRIVAKIVLSNGLDLNRELIKVGLAWWYEEYSDDTSLGLLEDEAKADRLGLWQDENPIPPWDFRNN